MEKNVIEEKMYKYSVKTIAQKTGIPETTLYRWKREENIQSMIDFIYFLTVLEIDPVTYMQQKRGLL